METKTESPRFYGAWTTVLLTVAIFLSAQLLASVLVGLIPVTLGWTEIQANSWFSDSVWAQFIFVLLVEIATIKILWEVMKRRGIRWRTIGFNTPRLKYVTK